MEVLFDWNVLAVFHSDAGNPISAPQQCNFVLLEGLINLNPSIKWDRGMRSMHQLQIIIMDKGE